MAGRRVFYGWPYYAWSAGFDASKRDRVYTELVREQGSLESVSPFEREWHQVRGASMVLFVRCQFIKRPNEQVYATYFPKVFEDRQNRYNSLTIYKIPDTPPANLSSLPEGVTSMFDGGKGNDRGRFDGPTGIAVDPSGNVLVADTNNGRIEKFSPTGTFLSVIRNMGTVRGQLAEPNGIAVDLNGSIYVAEAGNHRVEKLAADGKFHR